ncbi:MAG: glycosyltransferase family 4 protein, partial [Bacteroidia bacterium]|nr:glycosyltransferase family 4 protein [Bacteroidia bacterium]
FDKRNKSILKKRKIIGSLYKKGFEKIIAEFGKPDIIHLNVVFPAGIFALELSKQHNIPLVITEHWTGYLPEDGSYRGILKKYFTKKIIAQAKVICPVTKHLAENMQAHGLKGNYIPVPNVVDTEKFSLTLRTETSGPVFLHLSSFDERQKKPLIIQTIFSVYREANAEAEFIMAGDGENIHEIEKFSRMMNPKARISFHFRPMADELVKLFHSADVLVLNSAYENLPVVILEAMSCGLPVLSSNVGGIKEYVNSSNGILFDDIDGDGLLLSMMDFCKKRSSFNKVEIRNFAIKNFSKEEISKKFDSVYTDILKSV